LKFSLLFHFAFASFHFRFASDAKTSKNTFFATKQQKFHFRFISLQSENDGNFHFFFPLFSLCLIFVLLQIYMFCIKAKQAKKAFISHRIEKILLPFRFEVKTMAPPTLTELSSPID
jgi:hypothetical protein